MIKRFERTKTEHIQAAKITGVSYIQTAGGIGYFRVDTETEILGSSATSLNGKNWVEVHSQTVGNDFPIVGSYIYYYNGRWRVDTFLTFAGKWTELPLPAA